MILMNYMTPITDFIKKSSSEQIEENAEKLLSGYNREQSRKTGNISKQEIKKAKMLIDYYTVVGIDEIPEAFSLEKLRLEKEGQVIEDFDLMIGITGLEGNLIIVTHNLKHFNRIKGIQTEDWAI